jgi:DNA-3-methyladenine glycosylase II
MARRARRRDEAALAALRKADPVIGAMIDANPDFEPDTWLAQLPKMDAFGVLVFQVIGQQLSVAVTRVILGRLVDLFGGALPSPEQLLAADPERIRAAGLSRRKVQTLRDLAERFVDGRLDAAELERLPDEEVIARLVAVPGIGRWTAEGFRATWRCARPSSAPTASTTCPPSRRSCGSPRPGGHTAAWR